jgi:hypothetical protein
MANESGTGDARADTRAIMITFTSPAPGVSDEAFNAWYDDEHIPAILENVDGISGVTRYQLHPGTEPGSAAAPYVAIYEFTRNADEVLASFAAAAGAVGVSDTLDLADHPPVSLVYDRL